MVVKFWSIKLCELLKSFTCLTLALQGLKLKPMPSSGLILVVKYSLSDGPGMSFGKDFSTWASSDKAGVGSLNFFELNVRLLLKSISYITSSNVAKMFKSDYHVCLRAMLCSYC